MITVGATVKVAGTHSNTGRGNAVGVVTHDLGNGLFQVEAGVRDYGPCALIVRRADLKVL